VQAIGNSLSVLDRHQLSEITLDDTDLMREIVSMLIDDTSRQMHLLDAAIREQNAPQCQRLAHYSKGACANVGANSAAALFKGIESMASSGDFEGCAGELAAIANEIEQLRAEAGNL